MHTVVLIPGDGIGPEVSGAVRTVFEAAGAPIRFVEHQAGEAAIKSGHTDLLPEETLEAIRHHHVALKGPCTTRSEEHTSELQSRENLVCRLLLEKKKK